MINGKGKEDGGRGRKDSGERVNRGRDDRGKGEGREGEDGGEREGGW